MTIALTDAVQTFAYEAQTPDGQPVTGTLDAADLASARRRLESLALRILRIGPAEPPARPKALRGEDFIAFNQQLAHLTAAGLPVEHGLRLIARDMRSGRLASTIREVADDLQRGRSLAEAFELRRGRFPALYGRLIDAGVRTSNLPAALLNLGRHLELIHRLRAALWRAVSYPLVVLITLAFIVVLLGVGVLPELRKLYVDFKVALPPITQLLVNVSVILPRALLICAVVAVAVPILWRIVALTSGGRAIAERLAMAFPLIGPVFQRNAVARWCDALRIGVEAGMDLPAAIELAGDATASPSLRSDGQAMIACLRKGLALDAMGETRVLPASVVATIELASRRNNLAESLGILSELYQQQAETRLSALPAILSPLLLLLIALLVGTVIAALFMPMISLISAVSGGGRW